MMFRVHRKRIKSCFSIIFLTICCLLLFFYHLYSNSLREEKETIEDNIKLSNEIQARLIVLENGLKANRILWESIKNKIEGISSISKKQSITSSTNKNSSCQLNKSNSNIKITVNEIYEKINFSNIDGGVWKQGWNIILNYTKLNKDKLKIFIVPHSHNDPGWLKTFEQYYNDNTQHILFNMLKKLNEDSSLTFIWAEISFFSHWWDSLTDESLKESVKNLLDSGQLEIVTGGWVMNDEASTSYSAIINQMIEGHEWLKQNLNYRPRNGWAIDPFGLSPTMAFLLKKMGLRGMVIQRVHYSIKKYLALHHLLEFNWKQYWENSSEERIICHIEPFFSYDIPHTCGPDPKICCQFDFKRLPPSRIRCPWKIQPQKITDKNIHARAELLLDQYRKKSMLYNTNTLLVPLGDDFRFDKLQEWDYQIKNYKLLMNYINSHPNWNVEIKFGTLTDYFNSLNSTQFPNLSGDFFTYADRDDNYWSGYYTSRPFYKKLDRILESYVRGAEVLFSLGFITSEIDKESTLKLVQYLKYARTNLALFQHHDGITGTARNAVVKDYGQRLINAIQKSQEIISTLTSIMLHLPKQEKYPLHFIDLYTSYNVPPLKSVLQLSSEIPKRYVLFYNSLGSSREELVCLYVNSSFSNWIIRDGNGRMVEEVQLNELFSNRKNVTSNLVEACFFVNLMPLSLVQYNFELNVDTNILYSFSDHVLYNLELPSEHVPDNIEIEMDRIKLIISSADGMLRKVSYKSYGSFKSHDIRTQFMTYGTRKKKEKSGAYLFLPDMDEAQDIGYTKPIIEILKGPLVSRAIIVIGSPIVIKQVLTVYKGKDFFDIENEFHLTKGNFDNKELLMRFYTDIANDDIFFTDLNGFQMVKRRWYDKIPIQGNVYPMSSLIYIQDGLTRFNVLSSQPLGVTSRHSGFVDIFLDRRLNQDDLRGVGQGLTDNLKTNERFRIILESPLQEEIKASIKVQKEMLYLLNDLFLMKSSFPSNQGEFVLMKKSLPCDVHLMNFRANLASLSEFFIFFHRFGSTCEHHCSTSKLQSFNLSDHLSLNVINAIEPNISLMSLSLLEEITTNINMIKVNITIDQMDFSVYSLKLK